MGWAYVETSQVGRVVIQGRIIMGNKRASDIFCRHSCWAWNLQLSRWKWSWECNQCTIEVRRGGITPHEGIKRQSRDFTVEFITISLLRHHSPSVQSLCCKVVERCWVVDS
jgi:hypothetical protein